MGSLYPIETEAEYLDFKDHMSATWTDLKAIVLAGHLFNKCAPSSWRAGVLQWCLARTSFSTTSLCTRSRTIIDGLHQTKAVVGIALLPSNATGTPTLEPLHQFACRDFFMTLTPTCPHLGFACGAGKTGFSPAEKYPNKKWGLHPDSSHDWNPCVLLLCLP